LNQDDPPDEIWLINDGSGDDTLAMLRDQYGVDATTPDVPARSSRHPSLQVLSKPNSGKADSLNRGLALASSDLIMTLDADTVLRPGAVRAMRRSFAREPEMVCAGGVLTPRCGPGLSGRLFEWFQRFEYLRSFISRVAWMRADALLLISGAFACYRRDAVQTVGGFDAGSWVEDYELTHRLYRHAGEHSLPWRVRVLPDASALTDAPGTLGAFLRQRRRWFGGFLQTLYSNRDMVGNRTYASVGRIALPMKVADTLQPVFGLTAFLLLVVFALASHPVLTPVFIVIGLKLIIDLVFLLWGVSFYNRWQGTRTTTRERCLAVLAALTEPVCFQLLRHCGALLGWVAALRQRMEWSPNHRAAAATPAGSMAPGARYTSVAIFLHWAIALCLVINISLALSVPHLSDVAVRPVIDAHKSVGITVLGMVLLRLLWRATHPPPPPAAAYSWWERTLAHVVHAALYMLMLALPLSGWMHDSAWKDAATHPMRLFWLVPWPRIGAIANLNPLLKESLHTSFGQAHAWFADVLYVLFLLHVIGALKHQLLDRQPSLQRMLPGSNNHTVNKLNFPRR
jgi:cytochrome b561